MKRGKERLRTIQLDADVSEIAQKLADQKKLSSTLSELLRANYGYGDAIEEKKRELTALLDYKHDLQTQEKQLREQIDDMEKAFIHRETNVRPVLEEKLVKLDAKIKHIKRQAEQTIDASIRRGKYRAIENFEKQMQEIREQLNEFNSEGVL